MITVYTKPNCVQCTATKRALSKAGVTYREVDLTVDANALAHILCGNVNGAAALPS